MIAGGTPPDVININSPLTLELDGMLVELTDKMSDLGYFDPQRGLYPGWFTMLSSDGFYDRGEALYQAPLGTGTTILAYNQRLFDEAGGPSVGGLDLGGRIPGGVQEAVGAGEPVGGSTGSTAVASVSPAPCRRRGAAPSSTPKP